MPGALIQQWKPDGDAAFVKVDNNRPANMLEPGVVADAVNYRFDNGQANPRYGASWQAWGTPGVNLLAGLNWGGVGVPKGFNTVVGQWYFFWPQGQCEMVIAGNPDSIIYKVPTLFQATQVGGVLVQNGAGPAGQPILSRLIRLATPLGYARFTAPDTTDNTVLVTLDWRDQAGEDGGYGRAWRICPGNVPQEIPMNGHDAWDMVRLIPVLDGVVMLRGNRNERHYFGPASVAMQGPTSIPADSARGRTSNIAKLTITAHGLSTGMYVTITGVGGTGYNLVNVPVTKIDANTITYPSTGGNETFPTTDTTGTIVLVGGPIQLNLNCIPGWNDGDLVLFNQATGGAAIYGNLPPAANAQYYVKSVGGSIGTAASSVQQQLFIDAGCTQPLSITTNNPAPAGSFYLERQAQAPGPYGNGAPTLLMQGAEGATPFEVGFVAAPLTVVITGTAGNTANAPNHRLVPGDAVVVTGVTDGSNNPLTVPVYANPLSSFVVEFYDTQIHALAAAGGNGTGIITLHSGTQTGTLTKQSASGVPMPPAREGIYFLQRLVLVNQVNNVLISDPLDPLHFTPMESSLTGSLGENQAVTCLQPLGVDTLMIVLPNFFLALYNLSQPSTAWLLREVTRQYGMSAPLASIHVGSDVWGLGRAGVVSVTKTEFGELSGVDIPISQPIPKYIANIDWPYVGLACGETWNNRSFFAVPSKGQTGTRVNNTVLVFNALNRFLAVNQEIQDNQLQGGIVKTGDQVDAWEGQWNGDLVTPVDFARLTINGEERLSFVNAQGVVCWFSDDFTDMGADIATSLTPRAYYGGAIVNARVVYLNWDTFNPQISVNLTDASVFESQAAAVNVTYDRTKYLVWVASADNNFANPFRQDYSMVPDEGLYTAGVPFDVHQNITEKFPVRLRGRNPQLVIANTQGSCRINSVLMQAVPVGMTASNQT